MNFRYRRDEVVRRLRYGGRDLDAKQRRALQEVIDALMSLPAKEAEEILTHIEAMAREEDAKAAAKH